VRGNINAFVITTAGKDGEPLSGPVSNTAFFAATEDGKIRNPPLSKLPENTSCWIAVKPLDPQLFSLLKEFPAILFGLFTVISLSITLSMSKRDPTKGLWIFITSVSWLVAGIYIGITHLRK
jgi:hypothetical protein